MITPTLPGTLFLETPDRFYEVITYFPPPVGRKRSNGGIVTVQRLATSTSIGKDVHPCEGDYISRASTHTVHGEGPEAYIEISDRRRARVWHGTKTHGTSQ